MTVRVWFAALGCCGLLSSAEADGHYELFDEGERVVCLGDSITHGGMYPYFLQFAQLLRHPGSTARVFNAGVSGGSCDGALKRWPWDVEPLKGTLTFLMFGMNDVNRTFYEAGKSGEAVDADRQKALAAYAANERKMSDTILASGGKLVLVTPTPYDEYGTWQKVAACPGCNEIGLKTCAETVRALAAEKGLPVVELYRPLTTLLKRGDERFRLADRTHPDPSGHLVMLRGFLKALGVSPEIAAVTVSADGKRVESRHAEVSNVRVDRNGLEFCYSPQALPFPDFDGWREPLRVTGLPAGSWELRAANVRLGVFTSEELENGVDLARFETPSMEQARRALERMYKWRRQDSARRNLVKMDIRAQELGADPRDFKAACAAIDYWYSRHGSKGSNAGYYANLIRTYKENATNRTAVAASIQVQLDELIRLTRPQPYAIAIRKLDGLVPAEAWKLKFYDGMEANGELKLAPKGCRGRDTAVELKYLSGARKFGVEKKVSATLKGAIEWSVSLEAKCAADGEVGVAMEFFDASGKTLGIVNGETYRPADWTAKTWRFAAPRNTASASVHVLSLGAGLASFANACIVESVGKEDTSIAFNAYALPSHWNRDWNGGEERFTSFAEAPLPMVFHFKGDRARLKAPALEVEFPDELELRDAFSVHESYHGYEPPVRDESCQRDGQAYRRLRFENTRIFKVIGLTYLWERKLAVVLGPKDAAAAAGRTFKVHWRVADGKTYGDSGCIDLRFAALPKGLRTPKRFNVISWQSDDRLFSNDRAFNDAVAAYELAGVTTFVRRDPEFRRGKELERILEGRPVRWQFLITFSDSWNSKFLDGESAAFKALGARMSERNDGKVTTGLLCPDYFNNDPKFHAYYRDYVVVPRLRAAGVKAGDMVSGDLEPWGPRYFCTCRQCREAFARYRNLDTVPEPREVLNYLDDWVKFRSIQTETSVAKLAKIVRDYDPGIKVIDYDYIIHYGTDAERQFLRGCSKDASRDDKWLDAHICSYYHTCDKAAFEAIRNNTRKLKADYYPFGAIAGKGSYLRDGEVRNPAQVRQLALAAAVHGCPGIGFYKGIHYDGEHLLALMKARDEIAAVEGFPWGKSEGTLSAASDNGQFAWATSAADGTEVIALFNYDAKDALTATVTAPKGGSYAAVDPVTGKSVAASADLGKGLAVTVPAGDVRFVAFTPVSR